MSRDIETSQTDHQEKVKRVNMSSLDVNEQSVLSTRKKSQFQAQTTDEYSKSRKNPSIYNTLSPNKKRPS